MSRFKERTLGYRELNSPKGAVGLSVAKAAGKVRDDAKRIITSEGRVNTGALRQSVRSELLWANQHGGRYRVGTDNVAALPQHEGVEGPVLPRRAKVLRFKPKGSSTFIFRPRSSGFSGIKFLTRALSQLTVKDFYR